MNPSSEALLDERPVVVVGAAGKIGSVCTSALADAGARLALVDRDADGLDRVASQLHAAGHTGFIALLADAADPTSFGAAAERARDELGPPRGLLCLVGGVHPAEFGPFIGSATSTYDAVLDRNLRSAIVALELVGRQLVDAGRGGSVVLVSAATAFASAPYHALYGAAKAAVISVARTLAVEWGPLGVRVNTIAPGGVETAPPADREAMTRAERDAIPLGRRVTPSQIASVAAFLLADDSSAITGQTLVLDGGALAKPRFLDADNVPVFVSDPALRERMRRSATHTLRHTNITGG